MHLTPRALALTLLSLLPFTTLTLSQTPSHTPSPLPLPTLPPPIPFYDLPSIYAKATTPQPAATIAQILNTLSIYPLAIDGKNFDALSGIFTEDVLTNYSAPLGLLTPLSAVAAALKSSLAAVDTQHAYGTQIVEITTPEEARSVSYFTATHFGRGKYGGQLVYAYGQYQDTWIKLSCDEWRVATRSLVYMGPLIGNLSIFQGDR